MDRLEKDMHRNQGHGSTNQDPGRIDVPWDQHGPRIHGQRQRLSREPSFIWSQIPSNISKPPFERFWSDLLSQGMGWSLHRLSAGPGVLSIEQPRKRADENQQTKKHVWPKRKSFQKLWANMIPKIFCKVMSWVSFKMMSNWNYFRTSDIRKTDFAHLQWLLGMVSRQWRIGFCCIVISLHLVFTLYIEAQQKLL